MRYAGFFFTFTGVFIAVLTISTLSSANEVKASWYHEDQVVACGGGRFDPDGMTAAHRTLPCGTRLRVSKGDKTVTVTINDRGPYIRGRDLDLSRGAASVLDMIDVGVATVTMVED